MAEEWEARVTGRTETLRKKHCPFELAFPAKCRKKKYNSQSYVTYERDKSVCTCILFFRNLHTL